MGVFHALSHVAQRHAAVQRAPLAVVGAGRGADMGVDLRAHPRSGPSADLSADPSTDPGPDPARSAAVDIGCDQCLAFAQIIAVLASFTPAIAIDASVAPLSVLYVPASHCARAACAFRSRAPPRLS